VIVAMSWGYIAGYFDGEGNVNLHLTKRGDWSRGLSWFNTHLESLEEIQAFIGCGIVRPRKVSALGTKPSYYLTINRKVDILRVLNHMEPLLIIKRTAAARLREHLMESVDETRYENHGKVAAVSDEELLRMYNDDGMTYQAIADDLGGLSPTSIAQAFRLRGLKARGRADHIRGSKSSEETKAKIRETKRRQWADPEFRARSIAAMTAGKQTKIN